jgi:hypothetical protein
MDTMRTSRRTFVSAAVATAAALAAAPMLMREASAQDAASSPAALQDLKLPTLDVTITDTTIEGIPDSIAAGRYLVTATAGHPFTEVDFLQPTGMSMDEFQQALQSFATPADGGGAPSGDGGNGDSGNDAPPPFFYDFLLAGGVAVTAGQPGQSVIDLTPGDWMAWGGSPDAPQAPRVFSVTGEMPATLPEPASTATIRLENFAIDITAGALRSGSNFIKIENASDQPHFVDFQKGPDNMTLEQVAYTLQADMTGTPQAGGLNPETDFTQTASTATQSGRTTTWVAIDLEPGTYAALCFFPDKDTGMPHAMMGMFNVFTVES